MTTRNRIHRMDWTGAIPFLALHVIALVGLFFVPWTWEAGGLVFGLYVIRMFGVTGGYHRYFAHRSYQTSRTFQFLLAFLAQSSVQKGALWWAANHRHHHRFSDQDEDIHSPLLTGFWWSHVGWILAETYNHTQWDQIKDFGKYPELRWLNRYHLIPFVALCLLLLGFGGWAAVFWGGVVSTVLLWHGTFTINSLCHVWGTPRYQTTDTSKNHFGLALITLGEGWHNNHHTYCASTRQGFFWWEMDPTYWTLKALGWMGLVWKLKEPPLEKLEAKRISKDKKVTAAVPSESF